MPETIHLRPTAALADRVMLPGDPGRALLLAQELLESPKMFNHNRGLWGYSGTASDGTPLTIQSTGMGGPSAAIVISELAELGARRLLRVGTCGGLDGALALGDLVIAEEALTGDGTSRVLSGSARVAASGTLLDALKTAADGAAHAGLVVSTDLFYDPGRREQQWAAEGAIAVEMETATLFALGAANPELETGSILIVTDLGLSDRVRIDADALRAAELALGQVALRALAP